MDQTTIQRYQSGGDIYATLLAQYGASAAASIAAAALSGDETQVNAALVQAKNGSPLNTSTLGIFTNQMLTDPLAAPLASANNLLGNTVLSFLKSPWVIATLLIVGFFLLGGADFLRRKMKG